MVKKAETSQVGPEPSLAPIPNTSIPRFTYGADPEFFFEVDGKIIGAEKVIPEEGLKSGNVPVVVLDGVQAEMHPYPAGCRVQVAGSIASSFAMLMRRIEETRTKSQSLKSLKICWRPIVQVDQEELDSLKDSAKKFGCQESLNIYGNNPDLTKVDPSVYKFRGAGGHIHIGMPTELVDQKKADEMQAKLYKLPYFTQGICVSEKKWAELYAEYQAFIKNEEYQEAMKQRPNFKLYPVDLLVPLLDILVGNTCVMLDRDPLQAERRRYYGRAGEYRVPSHGLEYRTLSNWWLRSYPLVSLVFGLTRLAGAFLYAQNGARPQYAEKLIASVDLDKIQRAINENNLILAMANWKQVRAFLMDHLGNMDHPQNSHILPLGPNVMSDFDFFLKEGVERWFPADKDYTLDWASQANWKGWERFLTEDIKKDRLKAEKAEKEA